jgi:hypothetical protein
MAWSKTVPSSFGERTVEPVLTCCPVVLYCQFRGEKEIKVQKRHKERTRGREETLGRSLQCNYVHEVWIISTRFRHSSKVKLSP